MPKLNINLTNDRSEIFRSENPQIFLILVVPKSGFFSSGENVYLSVPEYKSGEINCVFEVSESIPVYGKIYAADINKLDQVKKEVQQSTNYNENNKILQVETKLANGDKYNVSLQRVL